MSYEKKMLTINLKRPRANIVSTIAISHSEIFPQGRILVWPVAAGSFFGRSIVKLSPFSILSIGNEIDGEFPHFVYRFISHPENLPQSTSSRRVTSLLLMVPLFETISVSEKTEKICGLGNRVVKGYITDTETIKRTASNVTLIIPTGNQRRIVEGESVRNHTQKDDIPDLVFIAFIILP
ncbi:MAG: hypothetical protein R2883_04140 [Caldisericia bacterium]